MSRRKQSNPKPLKREDEEWSDSEKTPSVSSGLEGGGGSALSSPTGAGGGSHQLADDDLVSLPPPTRLNATDPGSDVRLRLSAVQLSSPCGNDDVVRKRLAVSLTDEYENSRLRQQPSRPNSVLDSSPKSERLDDDSGGQGNVVTVADESRTSSSSSSSSANSQQRRGAQAGRRNSGSDDSVLEVKRPRLDEEVALQQPRLRLNASLATDPALRPQAVAALTIKPDNRAAVSPVPPNPPLSAALQNAIATGRLFILPNDINKESLSEVVAATAPRPTALICPPCGIRFSSASTLDAHQKYYCQHRPKLDSDAENNDDDDEKSNNPGGTTGNSGKFENRKAYACPHCSYSADKKVSLNRHSRMHQSSPVQPAAVMPPVVIPAAGAQPSGQPQANSNAPTNGTLNEEAERYCQNCDIRFSNLRTFRAHKTHYCSTRHVVRDGLTTNAPSSSGASASSLKGSPPTSSSPGDSPPPPVSSSQPQPCLALPTNPILIVPYSLVRGASVLAAPGLPAPNTPCFLLPNGTLQPMTRGLDAGPLPASVPQVLESPSSVLRAANKPITPGPVGPMTPSSPNSATSAPLDLSVRKSPDHEKENRVSPLSTSLPPPPGSPRSRGSGSPRARSLSASGQPIDRIAPTPPTELALRLAELPPPSMPGVLVKQGVSRCKECNIVFCRHENFVAHKKHYCQARESSVTSPPPSGTPSPPLVQLICVACGIKFASMDNLVAHQAFYCPKRADAQDHHSRCPKCKTVIEPGVAHTCTSSQTGGWRCPVCGAVSPTAGAAQRHMDSHKGVKAFRCTICQYKGNTLRGMRTHIRMHFEKRGADLQEENYITCVLENDETAPTPEPAPATTPEEIIPSEPQRINGKSDSSMPPRKSPQPATSPSISPAPSPASGGGGKVKQEPLTEPDGTSPQQQPPKSVTPDDESLDPNKKGLRYCHSCDISFQYLKTFRAHKQYYCSSHHGEASNNNINNNSAATTPATPATTPPTTGRTEASVL